jgi:hypothetical protein
VKAQPPDRSFGRGRSAAVPPGQPWFFLSRCQSRKTTSIRGSSVGSPAAALSALPRRHDHGPRTATSSGPRRPAGTHLGAAWDLSACRKTFTILPDWLAPWGHYSLRCRQQVCDRIAAGNSAEQAVPYCRDPSRLPDPSTLPRWVQRRLFSLWCWARTGALGEHFLQTPTIVAWDLGAVCRILRLEARSP